MKDIAKAKGYDAKLPDLYLLEAKLNVLPGGDMKAAQAAIDEAITLLKDKDDPTNLAKAYLLRAVMTEDDEPLPERRARSRDTAIHLLVRQTEILLGQRLALGDVLLLEVGQQRTDRTHRSAAPRPRPSL